MDSLSVLTSSRCFPSRRQVLLLMILTCAAVLRFWSLGSGIPYALGSDEPVILDNVLLMIRANSFHPPFFDYPGLIFYLHVPVVCLRFIKGAMVGEWASLASASGSHFYYWSRILTASLGVTTVYLVYRCGLRWGRVQALLAAAILAVSPLHVRESRYVLTDVPMTFFVTSTLLLTLRAMESGRAASFGVAAFAAGLATAIKYNAGIAVIIPISAALLTRTARSEPRAGVGLAIVGFVLGFLVGAPYAWLDLPGFLNGFANLATQYRPYGMANESGAWIYLKHLRINLGWSAFLLVLVGVFFCMVQTVRGPVRVRSLLLVLFPFAYYFTIADRSPTYARYLLPLLPFLCLTTAEFAVHLPGLLGAYGPPRVVRLARIVLVIVAIGVPARTSLKTVETAGKVSTQALAYQWFLSNVPRGSTVIMEGRTMIFPSAEYQTTYVRRVIDHKADYYRAMGARYLIADADVIDATPTDSKEYAAYMDLLRDAPAPAKFRSSPDHPGPSLWIIAFR